ncbi:hypothetical protein [Streptomyces sp. NPDC003832]
MPSKTPVTAADHRRVEWKVLDRALAPYDTDSLIVLLQAALASPDCQRLADHLLLMFTRVLRTAPRPGTPAGAEDLPRLVEAVLRAAPGRGVVTDRHPSDLRPGVRHLIAGEHLLVHPGQLAHPLLVLRSLQLTALAVDEPLCTATGFGIGDVLELALRLADRALSALRPVWPEPVTGDTEEQVACHLTPAEVDAATAIATADPNDLVPVCQHPERAARALAWLTRPVKDLPLRYHPDAPLLGPYLALTAHGRRLPVPVGAATDALAPAAGRLLDLLPPEQLPAAEARLQKLTVSRLARLLGLDHIPARTGPVCRLTSPTHRYDIAVVSALADGQLGARVEEGRTALDDAPPGRGRLVVYGGPRFLGRELIRDTALLHLEELAEILHAADGDPTLMALFLLELTEHPGVHGVAYDDALDAWTAWHHHATLLLPGPDSDDVVYVPAAPHDKAWELAANHAATDSVLTSAGLPAVREFRHFRQTPPDAAARGTHTDLEHHTDEGTLLIRTSTIPPVAIVAVPSHHPGALLDASGMAAFTDSLRTTLTTLAPVTAHATLPDGTPLVIEVTVTDQPYQPPATAPADKTGEAGELLLLRAGADPAAARIGLVIDPLLLAAFNGDGHRGHDVLGMLVHDLIAQVRAGRDAGPGTDAGAFTAAWNTAHPVLRLVGTTHSWPATVPAYTLPRTPHLHARALRTAAAAVRRARVPAGSWRDADAVRRGGPADQLLQALENSLAEQLSSHQPALLGELARQVNAAWAQRTRSLTETAVNLAAPWAENWTAEARHRQTEAATATSALHLLLQQTLIDAPTGTRPVDVLAVAELVALAELVLDSGITAVAAARGLHNVSLDIDPTGVFTLTAGPDDATDTEARHRGGEHLGFDAGAYQRARQQRMIAAAVNAEPELLDASILLTSPPVRTETPFTTPVLPPGSQLAQADRLLRQHWGCGLDALGAVLATACDWPTSEHGTATVTVTVEALVGESAAWSGLPADHLRAAVDRLRLHAGNAASTTEHAYTEVERRTRPLTHPLITDGEQLLVLPWLAHAAREAYAASLDDGRLPHPELPDPVDKALTRHRQQLDQRLESDVREAARAAGLPHHFRLLQKTAAQLGVPGLTGEIDLLVADPDTGRLWVIEAKNPTRAVAVHALQQHIKKFTTRYRDKLLTKSATIAQYPAHAAAACGTTADISWRVLPLMVTRTIEPAAFLTDPRIPYTTADHLTTVLTHPTDPKPGWNPAPATTP